MRYLLFLLALGLSVCSAAAQERARDSSAAAHVLADLIYRSSHIDPSDVQVEKQGPYYAAAPYIIYRGEDKARKWKDNYNYGDAAEKEAVDAVCARILATAGSDPAYRITGYRKETESEGTWHVLEVAFQKNGKQQGIFFAFLKMGGRFFLGDIDND